MIEMDQKEQILHYHRVDGLRLREISRRVGLNRKTVTRYIREYEDSIREDPEEGLDICLASKPKYPARHVECTRMTEPVCAEIEYWLQLYGNIEIGSGIIIGANSVVTKSFTEENICIAGVPARKISDMGRFEVENNNKKKYGG